jgi:hypothetical protein
MFNRIKTSCLILLLTASPAMIRAGSFFSSRGLGIPMAASDARAVGMAGLATAQSDPHSVSGVNPASLVSVRSTLLALHFYSENDGFKTSQGNATTGYANFHGFIFALPLKNGMGIALQLRPLTRMDYKLAYRRELAGQAYTKSVESRGGVNTFSFSAFWRFAPFIAAGVSGNYLFGLNTEKWYVHWDDDSTFVSTSDRFSIRHTGTGTTFGIQIMPAKRLLLGATYTPSAELEAAVDSYYATTSATRDGRTRFPSVWTAGATAVLGRSAVVGIEYSEQPWNRLTWNGAAVPGMENQRSFSAGGEFFSSKDPAAPYLRKMAYRAGFLAQPFFSRDVNGNAISEWWTTLGLGFPMASGISQIDAALAYGQRGSPGTNTFSEKMFKLVVSITVSERWMNRGRR